MKAVGIDPVCGMTVSPNSAAGSFDHKGNTYHFCSQGCLEKFRADPERFLKPASPTPIEIHHRQQPESPKAEYTCPMHPEVRRPKPGSCPKCGMSLEPMTLTAPKQKIEYTCPMHPQIIRDAPGHCPICGMALEPRTVTLDEEEKMQSAGVTLVKGDLRGIVRAIRLSRATMRNIKQNLFFAFVYNSIGVPIAAGVLYPFFGILLSPMIAAAAMSFSSVSVISNALRLRRLSL